MTNQLPKSGCASASHALIHTRIHTPVGDCYHARHCLSPLRAIRVQCLTQHYPAALFQVPPGQLSSSPCKTPSFHMETSHWVLPDSWCWCCILISQQLLIGRAQAVMANKHISSKDLMLFRVTAIWMGLWYLLLLLWPSVTNWSRFHMIDNTMKTWIVSMTQWIFAVMLLLLLFP